MTDLKCKLEEAATKRAELNTLMEEAKGADGVSSLGNIKSIEKPAEEIARRQEELKTIYGECESLKTLAANTQELSASEKRQELQELQERAEKVEAERDELLKDARPDMSGASDSSDSSDSSGDVAASKAWVEDFIVASKAELPTREKPFVRAVSAKSLFAESGAGGGWEPENRRTGEVVPAALKPVHLLDAIRQVPLSEGNAETFMAEKPNADPAATDYFIGEGGTFFEDSWDTEERSSGVKDVGAFIPSTRDQLDDVPGARALLQDALIGRVKRAVEHQLVNGTGNHTQSSGSLTGLYSASTTANQFWPDINKVERDGGASMQEAFGEAIREIESVGQGSPSAILMHPKDWWNLVTQQTSDGGFLYGGLAAVDAVMPRFHGVPVVKSQFLAEGQVLVGDFTGPWGCRIRDRLQLATFWDRQYDTGSPHSKPSSRFYIAGEVRLAFTVMRGSLFSQITL